MKIETTDEKENPFMKRKEYDLKVTHTGESTPSTAALQKVASEELDSDITKTEVVNIFSEYGKNESKALVFVSEEKEVPNLAEEEKESEEKENKEEPKEEKEDKNKESEDKKEEESKDEKKKKAKAEETKKEDTEEEGEEEEEEATEENEEKPKKKQTMKEGKKPPSKSKHNNVQVWKKYEVKNGKVERKGDFCHRCGEGTFIAEYENRKYCGKCGWGQIKTKNSKE